MIITYLGLLTIIIAWSFQLLSPGKTVQPWFILTYCFGVMLLVVDSMLSTADISLLAVLNLLSLLVALAVYGRMVKRK